MKQKFFAFLAAAILIFASTSQVNASFLDDAKNKLRDFWWDVQASIPFTPKRADLILWKMAKETGKADSGALVLNGNFKTEGAQPMDIAFNLETKPMKFNRVQAQADTQASFSADLKMQGVTVRVSGEVIVKDSALYFKLIEIPTLGNNSLSQIVGKWWKLPAAGKETQGNKLDQETEKTLRDFLNKVLAQDLRREIHKLQDEKVNGENTYAVYVVLKKEKLAEILVEMAKISGSPLPESQMQSLKSLNDIALKINVYQKNWRLAQIGVETKIKLDNQGSSSNLTMTVIFKDYGQVFAVTAPVGFEDFNPLMFLAPQISVTPTPVPLPSGIDFKKLQNMQNMQNQDQLKQLEKLQQLNSQ